MGLKAENSNQNKKKSSFSRKCFRFRLKKTRNSQKMSNSDDDSSIHGYSSSDEESEKTAKSGINLTGFLFGNIDRDGKLEDDFLDENSKKKLGGLSTVLGLKSIIEEEASKASTSDSKVESEDYEEGSKVPDAEDYSTINEALTDDSSSDEEEVTVKKEVISPEQKTPSSTTPTEVKVEDIKKEEEESKLMPP